MGRYTMGRPSRGSESGSQESYQRVRHVVNGGPSVAGGGKLVRREDGTFERKHPLPNAGDRFGELTVIGVERVKYGVCITPMVRVQCSCGAEPHLVMDYNLRKGKSTRCNVCAKKQSGFWRKDYYGYADIVPDDAHRRRLLGRISACINRCHNPKDSGYKHYGERGIHVYEAWRKNRRAFLSYVVTLDGWDTPALELDRIDVNKGYEPGNLRFISRQENMLNKRSILEMQRYIFELESRIRHLERGAKE